MEMRRTAAVLLLAMALAGCQSPAPAPEIPPGVTFTPAGEEAGFEAAAELRLYPHHELVGGGLASFVVHVSSTSGQVLRNVRTVVYSDLVEPYLESPHGYDLGPTQPSFSIGQTFTFPDWGEVEAVRALAGEPPRLRLTWDGGERFLEVPPEAITITQEAEPHRLPADPDVLGFPSHSAIVDHLSYSEGRFLSRARGVTAADLLDWYSAAMPGQGWEALPAHDGALLFRRGDRFVSLSAADASGRTAFLWSHLRGAAEVSEEEALRIVRARYPEDLENQWTASHAGGPEGVAPRWEVQGLRDGAVWVTAWVDAMTGELLRVQEVEDEQGGLLPSVPLHPAAAMVLRGPGDIPGMHVRGSTAGATLDWYMVELPLRGWEPSPVSLPDDRVLRFSREGQFLSLSADEGPDGLVVVWADLRSTPEVAEEQALAMADAVHGPTVDWAAEYVADFEADWYGGVAAPVWRVEGRKPDSDARVVVWVDALTAVPRRVMESEGR